MYGNLQYRGMSHLSGIIRRLLNDRLMMESIE